MAEFPTLSIPAAATVALIADPAPGKIFNILEAS